MSNTKFKSGDVVRLKSGGPKMTVRNYKLIQPFDGKAYPSDTDIECDWFEGNNLKHAIFGQETLEIEDSSDSHISSGNTPNRHSY